MNGFCPVDIDYYWLVLPLEVSVKQNWKKHAEVRLKSAEGHFLD